MLKHRYLVVLLLLAPLLELALPLLRPGYRLRPTLLPAPRQGRHAY